MLDTRRLSPANYPLYSLSNPSEGGPVHVRRSDHFRMSIGQQNHFRACMLALQHGLLGTIGENGKRIAGFLTANRSRLQRLVRSRLFCRQAREIP